MGQLWIAGCVVIVTAVVLASLSLRRRGSMLPATLLGSIGLFLLVTGWLFAVDPNAPKNEAIKTGGLAGGAVVALYALWLNDRRRRTDEERQAIETRRHELENARAEHDRSRVADERFARAIELLGHETEQVRSGALHALAGLARNRDEYRQTVLDVLCAYLRRPFRRGKSDDPELQVRHTAQLLINNLLPGLRDADAQHHVLNLTGAYLEYFDISERQVGTLLVRGATFSHSTSFRGLVVHGDAYFTESKCKGRLRLDNAVFHGKAWFSKVDASEGEVVLTGARFLGETKFAGSTGLGRD
ncbi:pentapeptide repeat-containing protein [Saccharothrix violaceirubra]|uniref:Pentapeptide repeat protein n=1 Tax=Saccharothrix violaceirubra TaxID=413306 RepID=A0A7W7TAH9_9PSEU|nr:pentapeptide repeat-containing protein [Saccharothrix violaceirubra]MBB4969535.1 hypothetical protein [Saccharothrix violaceirubra]